MLREVRPGVPWPPALQHALDGALAPEVVDRYDNVAELGRDVVRAVEQSSPEFSATATIVVGRSAPRPISARRPNDRPVSRAVLRRAIPWAAAAAVIIIAGSALAAHWSGTRIPRRAFRTRDTTVATVAVVQQAAPIAAAPAPPRAVISTGRDSSTARRDRTSTPRAPSTPSTLGRSPGKSVRHRDSASAPNVKAPAKPRADSTASQPQAAPDTSTDSRSAAAAREIHAHIEKMEERFNAGDMRGARQELGEAASMLSIVRDLDPDPEHAMALQRELGQGVRELIASCYRMRADSTLPAGVRCESLGRGMRAGRGGRG
jgi:hypothetical protein